MWQKTCAAITDSETLVHGELSYSLRADGEPSGLHIFAGDLTTIKIS